VSNDEVPHWDRQARELRFRGKLVKRLDRPAFNQDLILTSFQELNWTRCIDDPLSGDGKSNRKRRLRDTIAKLNRHQQHRLIRFYGNGTGKGVCWEPVDES